jgi:hypothetical protein
MGLAPVRVHVARCHLPLYADLQQTLAGWLHAGDTDALLTWPLPGLPDGLRGVLTACLQAAASPAATAGNSPLGAGC